MDNSSVQVIYWEISGAVALVTAGIAIYNFGQSIKQRKAELRWKQASIAKDIVHEMHNKSHCACAISMLDWFSSKYVHTVKNNIEIINKMMVIAALQKAKDENVSDVEFYILESFDWFFYYIDRIEQYIREGLIQFEHVKHIFRPYYNKIKESKDIYNNFMRDRYYDLAPEFWKRYEKAE